MKFAIQRNGNNAVRDLVADEIIRTFRSKGHQLVDDTNGIDFLLNLTLLGQPRAGRRNRQATKIISIVALDHYPDDFDALCYKTLVKTLSNLLICVGPANGHSEGNPLEAHMSTPEMGFYHFAADPELIYERMQPILTSRFAVENRFEVDLPERLWKPARVVREIEKYGMELKNLGLLPAPFPIKEVLTKRELDHIYKIFGLTGLSYGNVSARDHVPELGDTTFWMSGRGVDKSSLKVVGGDVFLVKGFDYEAGEAVLSVPPVYNEKGRTSVDTLEHWYIYNAFPEVGAIVHVHAWLEGVLCTRQNFPCGTIELADAVMNLLGQTGEPERAAVGLKNHGLTITGPDLEDIFNRIRGRLQTQVPMSA